MHLLLVFIFIVVVVKKKKEAAERGTRTVKEKRSGHS